MQSPSKQPKEPITLDRLAGMVQAGFHEVSDGFGKVSGQFNNVSARFDRLENKVDAVDDRLRIVETKLDRALYTSISHLEARVKRLEEKAGIKN